MHKATLSLGSNLGDKRKNISLALEALVESNVTIVARSHDYRTAPWGFVDQDWFVNACAEIETQLGPRQLLHLCLAVETKLGRIRSKPWGPRIIDIDILTFDAIEIVEPGLTLPHPHLLERAFVLVPLLEIEPDLTIKDIKLRDAL